MYFITIDSIEVLVSNNAFQYPSCQYHCSIMNNAAKNILPDNIIACAENLIEKNKKYTISPLVE